MRNRMRGAVVTAALSALSLVLSATPAQAHGAVYVWARTPSTPNNIGVYFYGTVQESYYHPMALYVYGQRKVCGFWGCNWHEVTQFTTSSSWHYYLGTGGYGPGTAGTHTYRTKSTGAIREPWNWEYFTALSGEAKLYIR